MSCSSRPMLLLPFPSKESLERPLKSRTLGSAMLKTLSRNSCIMSPRRVTLHPTVIPARSLKAATERFAFMICGRCPVINERSLAADSTDFGLVIPLPTPMFTTIFSSLGTWNRFLYPNLSIRRGTSSSSYSCFRRGVYFSPATSGSYQNSRSHLLHTLTKDFSPIRFRETFVGVSQPEQTSITLETSTGSSQSTTPPCGFAWLGRMCFFARFIPSTTTLRFSESTFNTLPRLPRSFPERTCTVSPFLICKLLMPCPPPPRGPRGREKLSS